MKKMPRKMPVRVTYVGIAALCYFATPFLLLVPGMDEHADALYTALMALFGLITAGVGGDTLRPSGMVKEETPTSPAGV
jgi:hypothetical protein